MDKVKLKVAVIGLGFVLLLPLWVFGPLVLSIFTRPAPDLGKDTPNWGGWLGTYDNPPQGDAPWVERRCPYPNELTGLKGYWNRVTWLYRNVGYGYKKQFGLKYDPNNIVIKSGNPNISDRDKIPGEYWVECFRDDKRIGFEYYTVRPNEDETECFRMRIGWKIDSSKYTEYGFAPYVFTINPWKDYGEHGDD